MGELYALPEGWEWKKLLDVANVSNKSITIHDNKKYNYIGLENIEQDSGNLIDFSPTYGNEIKSNKVIFSKDMVLYGKLRPYLNKVWKAEFDGIATTEILPFDPKKSLLYPDFLSYYLRTDYFVKNAMKNVSGSRMPRVTAKYIKNKAYIPLPPLQEQKRIVAKLDSLFERIDRVIALHQQNIDEADALMGAVLNEVFGELEEKYGANRLSEVVKINSGIALPKIFKDVENSNGEYDFFKVAQMNNDNKIMTGAKLKFTKEQAKKHKIKIFPKGSILIPKRGGAILTNKKRVLLSDASYDSNIMGLKADSDVITDEFLFSYMNSIDLKNFIDTATIPQINNKHIDLMEIPLPPLQVQQKTVQYLDQIAQKTEKLKEVQQQKLQQLKDLKASILDRAFRGEL